MKNRNAACFLAGMLAGILLLACGSTPAPVENPPPVPAAVPRAPEEKTESVVAPDPDAGPPDEASLDAVGAARERVNKARQAANDFNGSTYFSAEWDGADEIISNLEEGGEIGSLGQAREAAASYNAAADIFDGIFKKSIPLYVRERENDVNTFRAMAVDEDARNLLPDYFLTADRMAVDALEKYKQEDYYGARESVLEAVEFYRALITGSQALKFRAEIVKRKFVDTDPESFELADLAVRTAADDFLDMDSRGAQDGAEEAFIRYELILKSALEGYASKYRENADSERQQAVSLKANVAIRQEFELASSIYGLAEAAFREENFDEAVKFYTQAGSMYKVLGETAREKRRIAEDAIRDAELKMVESDGRARHAEVVLEGGSSQ